MSDLENSKIENAANEEMVTLKVTRNVCKYF